MTRTTTIAMAVILTFGGCRGPGIAVRKPVRAADGGVTLAWQPCGDAEHTTYDVRIFDEASGECVLARDGLRGTEVHVPPWLPAGAYRWTVRPRVETEDGARVGVWSGPLGSTLGSIGSVPPPPELMHPLEIR